MSPKHAGPPEDPSYARLVFERGPQHALVRAGAGRHAGSRFATAASIGLARVPRSAEQAPPLRAVRPLRAVQQLAEDAWLHEETEPVPAPARLRAVPRPETGPIPQEGENGHAPGGPGTGTEALSATGPAGEHVLPPPAGPLEGCGPPTDPISLCAIRAREDARVRAMRLSSIGGTREAPRAGSWAETAAWGHLLAVTGRIRLAPERDFAFPAGVARLVPAHARTARIIAATFARLGVGHAFYVRGEQGAAELVAAELRELGVQGTSARHEAAAASMADAYARIAGRLALLIVPRDRALLASAPGVAEAAAARTPLIVLAVEDAQGKAGTPSRHEDVARAAGASALRVRSAATAGSDAERAWRTAMRERRTVVLSVTAEALTQEGIDTSPDIAPGGAEGSPHRADARAVRAVEADIAALVSLLRESDRPVFIAGRGARDAGAEIAALAERYGALLATSTAATGLFAGDAEGVIPPHGGAVIGASGQSSTPLAAGLIRGADLIVSWGCALDEWTTQRGYLLNGVLVVQIDIEAAAIGAHRSVGLGIVGDCRLVALDAASIAEPSRAGYRTEAVLERIRREGRWRDLPHEDRSDPGEGRIDPHALTIALDDALPAERIVTIDGGERTGCPGRLLEIPDVVGFCCAAAEGPEGLGLASAIGAGIARPDRVSVLGTGDGGFHRAVAELGTAVRLGMPLVVLVYNESRAMAQTEIDIAAIARGFGADGLTVRSTLDLPVMAEAVRERVGVPAGQGQPLVIDARIVPGQDARAGEESGEQASRGERHDS